MCVSAIAAFISSVNVLIVTMQKHQNGDEAVFLYYLPYYIPSLHLVHIRQTNDMESNTSIADTDTPTSRKGQLLRRKHIIIYYT